MKMKYKGICEPLNEAGIGWFIFGVGVLFMILAIALGATSIEKIPKISASGQNFLDPLPPPLFEYGPYRRKRRYFVPNSNYKVRFF